MSADHAKAKERATKMVEHPKMFNRDNLELAAAYLELRELAKAVVMFDHFDKIESNKRIAALRKALED